MKTLFTLTVCAAAAWTTPVVAHSVNDPANDAGFAVVQARTLDDLLIQLQSAGFSIDDISRTFLGRIRVVASNDTTIREVVMSRTTGEIFSDISRSRAPGPAQAGQVLPDNSDARENSSAGGGSRETGSAASGGRSDGNGRSDNASGRSNSASGARDNGGAGRSNRPD
ncbi:MULTISPECIES: hypothetical protein [unclassified Yoonia]|uniref:hypothetical protein n=1 Tax=unclassified Yoonia TaxID=2629118 RepID=UPI002AFED683|nr:MULTISPECIES: hypothetical protein [unclassified Yoonia]